MRPPQRGQASTSNSKAVSPPVRIATRKALPGQARPGPKSRGGLPGLALLPSLASVKPSNGTSNVYAAEALVLGFTGALLAEELLDLGDHVGPGGEFLAGGEGWLVFVGP
jgi:hypothetical protein